MAPCKKKRTASAAVQNEDARMAKMPKTAEDTEDEEETNFDVKLEQSDETKELKTGDEIVQCDKNGKKNIDHGAKTTKTPPQSESECDEEGDEEGNDDEEADKNKEDIEDEEGEEDKEEKAKKEKWDTKR